MSRVAKALAELATMSPAQLRDRWVDLYDAVPPRLPVDLMRLGLAYRLQEKAGAGLPSRVKRDLVSNSREAGSVPPSLALRNGTQLFRTWNGRTICVTVEEEGFLFDGDRYRSLSAIARKVTGAHWSGPRFFGVTG